MRRAAVLLVVALAGCSRPEPREPRSSAEPEPVSVTHWTDRTELFVEYPPLVAGRKSRFAIHLTDLATFKPVVEGTANVELRRPDGRIETFTAEGAARPGVFGVDVVAGEAGSYDMSIRLRAAALQDRHDLGPTTVHATEAGAKAQGEAPREETISYLKEQQWTIGFATALVRERLVRESLRVAAEIEPRTGGVAEVTVPFSARLVQRGKLPALGTSVSRGQVLGGLIPPTANPADLPALELARAEAQSALGLARKERSRLERLLADGAVPLRRVEEARAVETTAAARLKAADARIAQYEATRAAEDESAGARVFLLRAPISGVIAETHATSGANVETGENLFKIVDVESVYVVGHVPEGDASGLGRIAGAEVEFPGLAAPRAAGRLVSVGRLVDPRARTVRLVYELDNRDRLLAVGQSGFLRVFTSGGASRPAVPESAVVDDAGRPVVFVQVGGESFARRLVVLRNREQGYVEVLEGLGAGDRVVVRGAYLIRLASLSSQVPAHGHVH